MACWLEVMSMSNGRVRFEGHNVFEATKASMQPMAKEASVPKRMR